MRLRKLTVHITIILSLALLVGSIHITPVDATEPTDIALVYEFGSQTLTVNVSHDVANPKTHYIETIEVQKNGLSILNRTYANQSFNYGVFDTFSVSTIVGDNLTVTAICKRGHFLTTWLIVTSTTATNPPPTETTSTTEPTGSTPPPEPPSGMGPAIVVGVGVIVFFIIFFAWLKPELVPDSLKQIGSRIRPGAKG